MTEEKELVEFNEKDMPVTFKPAQIDFEGYKAMKSKIDQLHDSLDGYKVTPENLTSAKGTRTQLNKLKRAINKRKIEISRQAEQPVNQFKDAIKGLIAEIDDVNSQISSGIKVFEDEAKKARHEQRMKHIKAMCDLENIDPVKIQYQESWDNKTYPNTKFEAEVDAQIETIKKLKANFEASSKVISEKAEELKIGPANYIEKLRNGEPLDQILKKMQAERDYLSDMAKKQAETKKKEQKELEAHGDKAIDPKTGEIKDKEYTFSLVFDQMNTQSLKDLVSFLEQWGINTNKIAVNLTGTKEQVKQLGQYIERKDLSARRVK